MFLISFIDPGPIHIYVHTELYRCTHLSYRRFAMNHYIIIYKHTKRLETRTTASRAAAGYIMKKKKSLKQIENTMRVVSHAVCIGSSVFIYKHESYKHVVVESRIYNINNIIIIFGSRVDFFLPNIYYYYCFIVQTADVYFHSLILIVCCSKLISVNWSYIKLLGENIGGAQASAFIGYFNFQARCDISRIIGPNVSLVN